MSDNHFNSVSIHLRSTNTDTDPDTKPKMVQGLQRQINDYHQHLNEAAGFAQNDPSYEQSDKNSVIPDNHISDSCIQYAGSCTLDFTEAANPVVALIAQHQFRQDALTKTVDGKTLDDYSPGYGEFLAQSINPRAATEAFELITKGILPNDFTESDKKLAQDIASDLEENPEEFGLKETGIFSTTFEAADKNESAFTYDQVPTFTQ